jgi:hypothetical protein
MVIQTFDKTNLKALRVSLDSALKQVAEEHGIALSIGNISFQDDEFTTRLTGRSGATTTESAQQVKWRKSFLSSCAFVGMKPEDLGKTVTVKGKPQVIVGLRLRAVNDIVLRTVEGKFVASNSDYIKRLLKEAA